MWNTGKVLIVAILSVGVAAALFAWQHQYRRGARVMKLWGADNTYRIRMAPECELLKLTQPSANATDSLRIDNQDWQIVQRKEISQARGLVHARQALIQDANYQWDSPDRPARWSVAVIFRDPDKSDQTTMLAIDLDGGAICDVQSRRRANVSPIVHGLRVFFDEQWQP